MTRLNSSQFGPILSQNLGPCQLNPRLRLSWLGPQLRSPQINLLFGTILCHSYFCNVIHSSFAYPLILSLIISFATLFTCMNWDDRDISYFKPITTLTYLYDNPLVTPLSLWNLFLVFKIIAKSWKKKTIFFYTLKMGCWISVEVMTSNKNNSPWKSLVNKRKKKQRREKKEGKIQIQKLLKL